MSLGVSLHEAEEKKEKPPGFFPQLYENVCKRLTNDDFENLQKHKDDPAEFLRLTHDLEIFRSSLHIREFYPEKNAHESKIKRDYGNKAYQEGKDLDALYLYTQAVIAAPCENSKDLSICLANRSAVLFALKAYLLALDDIKLALDVGYPKDLRFKLLERKAKILTFYKQFSDAQDCYKELLVSLDDAKLDVDKKLKLQKEAQKALESFKRASAVYNDPNVNMDPPLQGEVPKLKDKNPKYPAIANNIEFRYEAGRGRFAVATRDIPVADVVCVERPCVSHILPEYLSSNCAHCFKSMKAPMPCSTCSKVMYCSYKCRQIANSTYHRYECKIYDFLIASGMSIICFMAYRTIAQKPLKFFLENRTKFEDHDEVAGSKNSEVVKYLSDDYRNIFNLVTHHSERKMNDLFHRAMFSILLLRCLKKTGYFGEEVAQIPEEEEVLTDDECYIASLISHFLEVYQFNTHEVAQYEMLAHNREEGSKSVFIGGAVYPTLALFNHSCDPSIVRYYVEDTVIVQTIKNIKKGEEICENYGPIFFHSPKADRQDRLRKQYWFDCRCIPCLENWPQMQDMDNSVLNFKCHMCSAAVPYNTSTNMFSLKCVCGTQLPLLKVLKGLGDTEALGESAKKELDAGNLAKAQELYILYMIKLDELLVPPYLDYYKIQQYIWKCIWMRSGNRVIRARIPKAATEAAAAAIDEFDTVD